MGPDVDATDIGAQLGADGVNSVVSKVEQYCAYAEQRIALKNHPRALGLRAELSLLADEERHLDKHLSSAPPPGEARHKRRKAIYAWTITALLTGAGFFFALLSFEPFRLGWKSYVYCLGIAVVVPFLVDKLLDDNRLDNVVKALTAIAATAGIASLMVLAVIRGDLLAQQVQAPPAVIIDGDRPPPDAPNTFYGSTLGLLRIATVLLSFAMELGAGLALREAWRMLPQESVDWEKLKKERSQVRQRIVSLAAEVTRLEDEPALFAAQFWRDFYGSMLTHTVRNAMTKLLVLGVGMLLVPHARAAAHPHLNLVIAIDLTRSVNVKGPDGTTEFQKNIGGVTRILAQVPAGAHVSIVGITDRSFATPYILLSATVPDDSGYFGERLSAARRELVRVWRLRSGHLQPSFPSTDIIGTLLLASQIFNRQPSGDERVLVIFSDMRNHTRELDLESHLGGLAFRNLVTAPSGVSVKLPHVQVYVLGVDGAGKTAAHWQALEKFWTGYFSKSGAALDTFSTLRELPAIQGAR
ncbi:MAG: hypothetical protein M3O31_03845 [Acidobacteriota bacterium]|nr:hypothetical protein [Acidobacteriota bacterium]